LGQGNPNAIGDPRSPDIKDAHVADPEKATEQVNDPNGFSVGKTYRYAITPLRAGALTIPAIEYCYFDTGAERYETEILGPFTLQSLSFSERERRVVIDDGLGVDDAEGAVTVLARDILPAVTDPGRLRPARGTTLATSALLAMPVLAYAVLGAFVSRRRRFEQNTAYARAYYAKSKSRKRLGEVAHSPEPADALYRAVVGFVADKFDLPEAGITSADIERLFEVRSLDRELAGNFAKILRRCERARYASAQLSADEVDALTHAALASMDRLDASLAKGSVPPKGERT